MQASPRQSVGHRVVDHLGSTERTPLFLEGDASSVLASFPDASVDVVMTSPPYWGHREYAAEGIGSSRTGTTTSRTCSRSVTSFTGSSNPRGHCG